VEKARAAPRQKIISRQARRPPAAGRAGFPRDESSSIFHQHFF
jgi:hypothetical protein